MKKVVFVVLSVTFQCFAASPTSFSKDGGVYSNCRYVKLQPVRFDISQSCGDTHSKAQGLCVGLASCDFEKAGQKEIGLFRTVACEANPNGTCPPPVECFNGEADFVSGFEGYARVQTKDDALAEMQRATQYGTHESKATRPVTTRR